MYAGAAFADDVEGIAGITTTENRLACIEINAGTDQFNSRT